MPLTAKLAMLPSHTLLFFIVMTCNLVSIGGLLACRRLARPLKLKEHLHVVGYSLAIVGVIYGLLLSVAVTSVCNTMREVEEQDEMEAADTLQLMLTFRSNPHIPGVKAAEKQLMQYMESVIQREYPAMKRMERDPITNRMFKKFYVLCHRIAPKDDNQRQTLDHILSTIEDLTRLRAVRLYRMNEQLPGIFWLIIIGGSISTLGFMWLFPSDHILVHILISIGCATLLGIIIFLIISLEYPYLGYPSLGPEGYRSVLKIANQNL